MMRAEVKCGRLAQVHVIVGEVDDKLNSKAYIVSKAMLCLSTSLTLFLSRSRMHALELTELPRGSQVHVSQNIL